MEGLAWELERLLVVTHGGDSASVDQDLPVFPYKTSRMIFEGISRHSPGSEEMAKIIILALQTTDPGASFVDIAQLFSQQLHAKTPEAILEDVERVTLSGLEKVAANLLDQTLGLEVQDFDRRGPAGRGITLMANWCRTFISHRMQHPFFEIELAVSTLDRGVLLQLFKTCPPCPIIQKIGPDPENIQFIVLSEDEPCEQDLNDLGCGQALMQYVLSHQRSAAFVATDVAGPLQCRFLGSCRAPLAQANSEVCRARPWDAFSPENKEGCWFSQAVSAARTRRDL